MSFPRIRRRFDSGIPLQEKVFTMEQRNIIVILECYVRKNGKYLMLHRNKSKRIMPDVWMAPGGKREFNEGLFEAARREIREETGLEIKNLRIICTGNAYLKDIEQELFFHFVEADYDSGEVHQSPEDGELVWLTVDEILEQENLLSELKQVLPLVLRKNLLPISYKAVYDKGNNMTEFSIESGT